MEFSVDEAYMRMALSIAQDGLGRVWPNPSVGCVIVNDGVPVGHGRTADGGRPHAEAAALAMAGERAKGATVYVTLEPCAERGRDESCSDKLIAAEASRVVIACYDPNPVVYKKGVAKLEAAGIKVDFGLYEGEAIDSHIGFFTRLQKKRPFVSLKQAVSSNGMIASAPGERTQISGHDTHEYLHLLRSTYDAIAVGIGTVLADDPML
ncbi:MAG: bifunctional diaminohydroxyphosphoribosylaminopyrimidine deaminase/5-amino-6-(5-phosphoribosylamino)uracil reductase RibD, partial [Bdellovibrionales bacterium]